MSETEPQKPSETAPSVSDPGATLPSPAPSGDPPNPIEHRFTETDAPYPWAVGKTVKEVMDLSQGAFQTLQTFTPPEPSPAPAPQQTPTALQNPTVQPPNPELALDNPAEYQRQLQAYTQAAATAAVQQQATSFASPLFQQQAQMARSIAANDPAVKEVFDRYGPEIDTQMATVDPQYRTVEAYVKLAKLVKGEHLDDFIAKEVERRSQFATPTITGDPGGAPVEPATPQDAIDKFFESDHPYVARFKEDGVTKARIRENIRHMGLTPEQYINSIVEGNMISTLGGRYVTTNTLVPKDRS